MAALPYMQLYVADYLADTAYLDVIESGAYLHLLMNYWQTGKPLPNNDKKLARIAKCTDEQWLNVRSTVVEYFVEQETVLIHNRVEDDLLAVSEKLTKASKAGKASAKARAASRNAKKSTDAEQESNERSTDAEQESNERSTDAEQESNERSTDVKQTFSHTDTDTDTDTDIKEKTCPELKSSRPKGEISIIDLPLNAKNTNHSVSQDFINEISELYPAVDVTQQLREMKAWLIANPTKRKTKSGILRFINQWLAKEQNSGKQAGINYQQQGNKDECFTKEYWDHVEHA